MFKLPTFQECLQIVDKNEAFLHKVVSHEGYKFHLFNYMLAQYKDFKKPISDSDVEAFELRGLTFLENENGIHRYLMLHKFFNINQCEEYQYDDLKDLKIKSIEDKRDGSMIRFVKLPDGRIIAKTKMDFANDQTAMANRLLASDSNLYSFVSETLDEGLAAIFELTSIHNRIVIAYKETKLTLIKLRSESTGDYLELKTHPLVKKYGVSVVDDCPLQKDLDFYLKERETILGIEGWVFSSIRNDGSLIMFKVKTVEYCEKHHLMTDTFQREDALALLILDEKVDDVLGELDQDDERRSILIDISDKLSHHVNKKVHELYEFVKKEYKGDKKEFAIKYSKLEDFPLVVKSLSLSDEGSIKSKIYEEYVAYLKRKTYRLEQARKFFRETLGINIMDYFCVVDED